MLTAQEIEAADLHHVAADATGADGNSGLDGKRRGGSNVRFRTVNSKAPELLDARRRTGEEPVYPREHQLETAARQWQPLAANRAVSRHQIYTQLMN